MRNCEECIYQIKGSCSKFECKETTIEQFEQEIRDKVIRNITLQILDIRATLHDIQRMDMPKELFDRLNYELDKKLYELQEQMKGEQNE